VTLKIQFHEQNHYIQTIFHYEFFIETTTSQGFVDTNLEYIV